MRLDLTEQEFRDILDAIDAKLAILIPHALSEEDHQEINRFHDLADKLKNITRQNV